RLQQADIEQRFGGGRGEGPRRKQAQGRQPQRRTPAAPLEGGLQSQAHAEQGAQQGNLADALDLAAVFTQLRLDERQSGASQGQTQAQRQQRRAHTPARCEQHVLTSRTGRSPRRSSLPQSLGLRKRVEIEVANAPLSAASTFFPPLYVLHAQVGRQSPPQRNFNATGLQTGRADPPGDDGVQTSGTPAKSVSGGPVRAATRSGPADSGAAHGAACAPNRARWAARSAPGVPPSPPPTWPARARSPYRPGLAASGTTKQGLAAHRPGAPTPGCARAATRADLQSSSHRSTRDRLPRHRGRRESDR